jgi:hypothetical protein
VTRIIQIDHGKQIVVSADDMSEVIYLSLWGSGGSIGLQLDKKLTQELRKALFEAIYPAR